MLKNSFILAMLIAIAALAVTGFASASEDQTAEINCVPTVCFEETAWAAQCQPGINRFVEQGNWGTYVKYELGSATTPCQPKAYPIYAGQSYPAGTLYVYDNTKEEDGSGYCGTIYVKYVACGCSSKDGYKGSWSLSEYHLQIVDEKVDFCSVTTKKGNPIPGQFDCSKEYDGKITSTGWIPVDVCGYHCDAYIAAHSVMQFCGYPTPV